MKDIVDSIADYLVQDHIDLMAELKQLTAERDALKALCDQMGEALEEAMYSNSTDIAISKANKALSAWREMK